MILEPVELREDLAAGLRIRIQSGQWIRIRIRNPGTDSESGTGFGIRIRIQEGKDDPQK